VKCASDSIDTSMQALTELRFLSPHHIRYNNYRYSLNRIAVGCGGVVGLLLGWGKNVLCCVNIGRKA